MSFLKENICWERAVVGLKLGVGEGGGGCKNCHRDCLNQPKKYFFVDYEQIIK